MKIALAFPGCHRRGGVERVLLECANFLGARGHETHVYASDWDDQSLSALVNRHRIAAPAGPSLARLLRFQKHLRAEMNRSRFRANVIGGYGVLVPPGAVVWAQSVHKAWLEISGRQRDLPGRMKQKLNATHWLILAMERAYFGGRKYRKMIALSDQVKNDLVRLYAVPPSDIVVIPNGFAPTEFNTGSSAAAATRSAVRSQLGYGETDKVVIFVANELERKGFGPLLRAVAALNDRRLHLLAVGRLDARAYAAQIKQLGLTDQVRFTGPTSNVAAYYAGADVFALPTQYEAWGLVIVEAMACGLPVVTSRLAGAAAAVREGETGELLEDPRNPGEIKTKLGKVLEGNTCRDLISASVAGYAWPRVLLRYEQVLAECAG